MEDTNQIGINLRSLLDGELGSLEVETLFSYEGRNKFIDKIEARLIQNDWISLSNGTTFTKSFTPTKK